MSAQPVLTARQIRHRVIGAIVFVSLCIIILPFFWIRRRRPMIPDGWPLKTCRPVRLPVHLLTLGTDARLKPFSS